MLNGIVSANLAVDIFFVRVKAGLGYQYEYNTKTKDFAFGRNATAFDKFKEAYFDIYTGVDFKLGPVVVGAYATLPTGVSIENGKWAEIFSTIQENWKQAQIGVSVGFALL